MEIPSIIQSSVPKAVLKNKGDIATAADDGQLETLSVGPDGTVLTADSSQPTGFRWVSGNGPITNWGDIAGDLSIQSDLVNILNGKEPANANIQGHIAATGNPHGTTKAEIGLANVTNDAQIPKTAGTAKGSLLGFSGSGAPAEVPVGVDNQVLMADSTQPSGVAWKEAPGGTAAWGSIDGALSNQTDLQTALNSKAPTTSGTSILKGDGTGGFVNAVAETDYLAPTGDGSQLTGITPSQVGLDKVSNDKQVKATTASTGGNFVSWSGSTGDSVVDSGKKAADFAAAAHAHAPSQVGLANVTNDAQVKKAPISVDSNLVVWSGTTGDTVGDGGKKISDLAMADHNHNGVYEPANANIQSHVVNTANPHNVTAGQVLPDQTGKNGKFLTSNGTTVAWGDPSAGTPPTGNGFRHVTDGAEDPGAKLVVDGDVDPAAAIAESKLNLNFHTHDNACDPATGEKAALAGTSGTPGPGNLYVTDADPRNTNARPPTAHGSSAHTGTIGTPSQVGLGNVSNVDATNPVNITQDGTHRFVTDTEKATWNGKLDSNGSAANLTSFPTLNQNTTGAAAGLMAQYIDWNASSGGASIKNKPIIPTALSQLSDDVTHRVVTDTDKAIWTGKQDALGFTAVPNNRQVNGHVLSADVTVTKADVGLGNVTNDAQLKTAAGDFASFLEKASPVSADLLLIEDSAASGAKKKVQVGNLPGGASLPAQTGHSGQFLSTDGSSASWSSPSVGSAAWNAITTKPEITVGDTGYGATIQSALTAIGASEKVLVVPPGNYVGPATIPSNVTIRFARGTLLTSGALTINGELQAGDYNILNGGTLVIGSTCRNSYVSPRWWGAKGDDNGAGSGTDDYTALNAMVTAIGSTPMTVRFSPGKYKIGTDLTFPANITVVLPLGAMLVPMTVSCTGTLNYAYTAGAGTVTLSTTSRKLAGVSGATPMQYLKTQGGSYYRIHYIGGGYVYAYNFPSDNEGGGTRSYSLSPYTITGVGSAFNTELEAGDFIYCGGQTLICSNISDANNAKIARCLPTEVSAAFTRAVRAKILGNLEAGRYQVFSGNGVVKCRYGAISAVFPEWWGAVRGDSSKAAINSTAFDKAVFSAIPEDYPTLGGVLSFAAGQYYISYPIPLSSGMKYEGKGASFWQGKGTCITSATGFNGPFLMQSCDAPPNRYVNSAPGVYDLEISGIYLLCNAALYGQTMVGGIYVGNAYNNVAGSIHHNWVYNGGNGIVFSGSASRCMVHNNRMGSCRNGLMTLCDQWACENEINFGTNIIGAAGTFATATGWTAGTGWTITTGSPGVATKVAGTASDLYYTFPSGWMLIPGSPIVVIFTITRTAGSYTITAGGLTLTADYHSLTAYVVTAPITDPDTDPTLRFSVDASFAGTVSAVYVYTGIGLSAMGDGVNTNNIIYGDNNGGIGVYLQSGLLMNNRVGPAGAPLYVNGGGDVSNNRFYAAYANGINLYSIGTGRSFFRLKNNRIDICVNYGLSGVDIKGSEITDNSFITCGTPMSITGNPSGSYMPLVERNMGIDLDAVITLKINSATPDIQTGMRFVTANTSNTLITDFANGCKGKEIHIRFGDGITTLDFSNSSGVSKVKGNKGVNVTATAGDHLRAVKGDDSNWYCEYFDNTP
ncbi:MAG: right-handed parallel beta-helix repeat-containing protein [Desulfobaccales bacterium]